MPSRMRTAVDQTTPGIYRSVRNSGVQRASSASGGPRPWYCRQAQAENGKPFAIFRHAEYRAQPRLSRSTIARGVFAGAKTLPCRNVIIAKASLGDRRHLRRCSTLAAGHRQRLILPLLTCGSAGGGPTKASGIWPPKTSLSDGAAPLRDMREIRASMFRHSPRMARCRCRSIRSSGCPAALVSAINSRTLFAGSDDGRRAGKPSGYSTRRAQNP